MSKRVPKELAAKPEDVSAAYEALSHADLVRLRDYARWRVRISGRSARGEWQDLLSEAMERTLDGRRRWKKNVSLTTFLIGVMQSISSNDWITPFERQGKYIFLDADLPVDGEDSEECATERAAGDWLSGEDEVIADEEADPYRVAAAALKQHFAGDKTTLEVIDGIMAEMTGPEIKELTGIDQTRLESTMKGIRRAAKKLFGSFEEIGKDRSRGH